MNAFRLGKIRVTFIIKISFSVFSLQSSAGIPAELQYYKECSVQYVLVGESTKNGASKGEVREKSNKTNIWRVMEMTRAGQKNGKHYKCRLK
jgi:hypothetical protein